VPALEADLANGARAAVDDGNGCRVVGKIGGIPGRADAVVVLLVVEVEIAVEPGVTAAAASFTSPITLPKRPPAAWPTFKRKRVFLPAQMSLWESLSLDSWLLLQPCHLTAS